MLLAMLHFFTAIPKRGRGTFFVLGEIGCESTTNFNCFVL